MFDRAVWFVPAAAPAGRACENEPVTYKLAAVNPQEGKSATFEKVDKELLGVLETIKDNKGTVCTLHVTIDGKHFSQKVEEHDHHDH